MTAELEINPGVVADVLRKFISEEVLKVGAKGVVVGVSGGVDSALALKLAAQALGPAAVVAVALPYRQSSVSSLADARLAAADAAVELELFDVSPQIDAFLEARPNTDPKRLGNKISRERMAILYDLSEERSGLVLGTSNKSELLLGYGTLYGDMAHALNPLGDLYKTQVYQLAAHLELPPQLLAKPPSADLHQGQLDETDLGFSYADADRVLFGLVDERRRPSELVEQGLAPELVETVLTQVRRNQFKRRLPLVAKLSARTVSSDFRYPRDWGH